MGHWVAVFHDSFTAGMTSTQRNEGMNNVFKKRFPRKLYLPKLSGFESTVSAVQSLQRKVSQRKILTMTVEQNSINVHFWIGRGRKQPLYIK